MTKSKRTAGRPAGKVERKRIELPGGDALVPLYTTFSEITGLHPKSLQRMRRQLPTAMVAGILYVKDAAGREALANPNQEGAAAMKHQTKMIRLADITVPPDPMRQLRPDLVDELAESIKHQGLLHPIIIRPQDSGYALTAGHHRLEAVRKLGHEAIECRVLEGLSADQALLTEVDENLMRADLTPSERAAHHAKRKQLYLKLHPETEKGKAGGRPRKTSDKMSKVSTKGYAAAKKVGKTSRTVARDVSRGEKIDPQALADLAGTCLDNGTELDALAKLPAAEQRSLAEAAAPLWG